MLESAESQVPKLMSREIIFCGIPTRVITVHQRYRQTDVQLIMAIPRYAKKQKKHAKCRLVVMFSTTFRSLQASL